MRKRYSSKFFIPVLLVVLTVSIYSGLSAENKAVIIKEESVDYLADDVDYKKITMFKGRSIDVHLLRLGPVAAGSVELIVGGRQIFGTLESAVSALSRKNYLCGISYGGYGQYSKSLPVGDIPGQMVAEGEMITSISPLHPAFNAVMGMRKDARALIKKPVHPKIVMHIDENTVWGDIAVNVMDGLEGDRIIAYTKIFGAKTPYLEGKSKYVCFFKNSDKWLIDKEIECEFVLKSAAAETELVDSGVVLIPLGKYEKVFERILKPNQRFKLQIDYSAPWEEMRIIVGGPSLVLKERSILIKDVDMSTANRTFGALDEKGDVYFGIIEDASLYECGQILRELNMKDALVLGSGPSAEMVVKGRPVIGGAYASPAIIGIKANKEN